MHYYEITEDDDERITKSADPYVFRISEGHHELFIKHYYDGADYVPEDHREEASAADTHDNSTQSDVSSSEKSMNE